MMAQWIRHRMVVIIGLMIFPFSHHGTITKSISSDSYIWKNSLSCFNLTKLMPFGEKCELFENLSLKYFKLCFFLLARRNLFLNETRTRTGCSASEFNKCGICMCVRYSQHGSLNGVHTAKL